MKQQTFVIVISLLMVFSVVAGNHRKNDVNISQKSTSPLKFTGWSRPANLGPIVNSNANDLGAALSKDELSLYFTSTRAGLGGEDIWVSQRANRKAEWGTPVNLGSVINSGSNDRIRSLSSDGHLLLFQSDRPGGFGGSDIWVSRRRRTNDDFAWEPPVNLGTVINSNMNELGATYLLGNDGQNQQLYFASNRPGGLGGADLYSSEVSSGSFGFSFSSPVNLVELNSVFNETCLSLRSDALEIIFTSTRPDPNNATNSSDLWFSTRRSVFAAWSPPVNLGPTVNADGYLDAHPALSFDAQTLIFTSNRPDGLGGNDLYITTREKRRGD
jgi:hypothetical protein